jgi:O-antigen/teichoic acid export membrane protein
VDDGLKKITTRNISYNAVATLLVASVQFLTNVVLARVLTPADYGIVGFATIFIAFMMQFGDFGINNAVVQPRELDEVTLSTAFTLKALLSVGIFLLLLLGAPLALFFMDRPEVVTVIRLLALNFLFSVGSFLPQVLLTRQLDYRKLAFPATVAVIAGAALAIVMAYSGFGFWSMAANSIAVAVITAVGLNLLHPAPVSLRFDPAIAKRLLRFGGTVLIPGVIVYIIFNTDNFVIGTLRGAEQLGYYAVAFNWGSMVCSQMAAIFHKVLFPTFTRLQHDIPALKKAYLTSVRYIAFLTLPVNIFLLLYGREFLVHVLGRGTERWLPALPALQILCVYGIFRALLEPLGNVILGIGKPELCLKAILLVAVIELGLLYPVISTFGITGVAVAVTIAYLSQYLVYLPIMKRELNVRGIEVVREIRISLYAAVIMAVTMNCARTYTPESLVSLLVQGVCAAGVYLVVYALIDRGRLLGELKALAQ